MIAVETSANAIENWNAIWEREGANNWRSRALGGVYQRIRELLPPESLVADLGGGCGDLGALLREDKHQPVVIDHSQVAINTACQRGLDVIYCDLGKRFPVIAPDIWVSTEFLEHLEANARARLMENLRGKPALLSVPNYRLGPDEEPQHTIKWSAITFKLYLQRYWQHVRVEVIDGYLLGVCGFEKPFTLSVTFPARDEEKDIERTLASFRGVADELVVGIDPRSKDHTEEIARRYCDRVFILEDPQGGGKETDVHFANIRNQCIEHCDGDWIMMTEAHEHLEQGRDHLLALHTLEDHFKAVFVWRRGVGGWSIQRWVFPWLFRNIPELRFKRRKHNILEIPEDMPKAYVPEIVTFHQRHKTNAEARTVQRKKHNRKDLFADWQRTHNENSLYYFASEWRGINDDKAIENFERLLSLRSRNGCQRYQARLLLAKLYLKQERWEEARKVLMEAGSDDWTRVDHWCFLGDVAMHFEQWDEAITWYLYATTKQNNMPFSPWWIDEVFYTYLPAMRLASCYAAKGNLKDALFWAKRVPELFPEGVTEEALAHAEENIRTIEEAMK